MHNPCVHSHIQPPGGCLCKGYARCRNLNAITSYREYPNVKLLYTLGVAHVLTCPISPYYTVGYVLAHYLISGIRVNPLGATTYVVWVYPHSRASFVHGAYIQCTQCISGILSR